jgi:hypothetical protein
LTALTEEKIVALAAPVELQRAREENAQLRAQIAAKPSAFSTTNETIRAVVVTCLLVVLAVCLAHRAILWGWP